MAKTIQETVAHLAREHFRRETLEIRGSDGLDFFDCYVGALKDALEAAYSAGHSAGWQGAEAANKPKPQRRKKAWPLNP